MISKSIFRFLAGVVLPVLLLLSCGNDYDVDIYGKISGKVTDSSSGNPIEAAQVTLVPGARTVQTTADGTFSFSDLEEGQYTVSVQKDGYQANRKNLRVMSGETTETVVTLTAIPTN